jgi:hypothetical protein
MAADEITPKAQTSKSDEGMSVDVREANEGPLSESLTTPTPSKTQFNANAVEFVPGQLRASTAPNPSAPVFTPQFQLTPNGYVPINPYSMPYYMYVPTNGAGAPIGTTADGTVVVSPVLTYHSSAGYNVPRAGGKGGLSRHNSAGGRSIRSEGGYRKSYRQDTKEQSSTEKSDPKEEAPVIKMEDFPSVLGNAKSVEELSENKPSWAAIAKKTSTAYAPVPTETFPAPVSPKADQEPIVDEPAKAEEIITVVAGRAASSVGSPKTEPREPSAGTLPATGKPKLAPWARPVEPVAPVVSSELETEVEFEEETVEKVEPMPVEEEVEEEETEPAVAETTESVEDTSSESKPSVLTIEMMKRLRYHESCRPTAEVRAAIPNGLVRQRQLTQSGASEADDWRAEAAAFAAKGRQRSKRGGASRIEISPEMLIPSENSWSAAQQNALIDEDVRVGRKIFAVLNKLTVEKFAKLSDQLFTECGIAKPTHIVTLVKYLFQKATMQHHFIPMYADLCTRCLTWLGSDAAPEELVKSIGPGERTTAAADIFRRVLLERCQEAFYSYFLSHEDKESTPEITDEEARLKHRLSMLGTVKFVAQLLERRLMTRAVFRNCLEILLNPDERTDDHIECACVFLTEIGKLFEETPGQGPDAYSRSLQDAMDELTEIAEEEATSARIKFLIMNLVDLRSNKYVVKTLPGQAAGPTKIADVHKQAAKEDQIVRAVSRLSHSQSTTAMPNDDEWETVPRKTKDAPLPRAGSSVSQAPPLPRSETKPNPWKRSVSSSSSE